MKCTLHRAGTLARAVAQFLTTPASDGRFAKRIDEVRLAVEDYNDAIFGCALEEDPPVLDMSKCPKCDSALYPDTSTDDCEVYLTCDNKFCDYQLFVWSRKR